MSIPKEPRQLMINLMYLVLTAMLALNVSSEILNAFKVINKSISTSNASIDAKNAALLKQFDENEQAPGMAARIKPYNDKAKQIHTSANAMYEYLEAWKERVVVRSGGRNPDSTIKAESDIDASTVLLVEGKGGDTIKAKLTALYDEFLSVLSEGSRANFANQLPIKVQEVAKTENNPDANWSRGMFYNIPVPAAITMFSKMQNDIRNSEAMVIEQLFKDSDAEVIKVDATKVIALPTTSYALAGDKIEAQILLAAYNSTINPSVSASNGRITKSEKGVAYWEGQASGVGMQTVKGTLSYNLGGRTISDSWEFKYMVGSTGASLQLDKMNVFYIGVENPVTISAAGYSIEDVSLVIDGATVNSKGKGTYDVIVSKVGEVEARILGKTKAGASANIATTKVRVKEIPNPTAVIGNKFDGYMPANQFKVQLGIIAELKNFDFDVKYSVISFDFSIKYKNNPDIVGPFTCKNALFSSNPQGVEAIKRMKAGDKIFIENIKAVGPDKKVRSLNPINLTLN